MGNTQCNSSCGCLDGLRAGGRRRFPEQKQTSAAAFALLNQSPRAGSWKGPEGQKLSQVWATPVPHRRPSRGQSLDATDESGANGFERQTSFDPDQKGQSMPSSKCEAQLFMSPKQVLPRPMSAQQRESAIRKILPTATHELLSKLSPELVEADGLEGQTLRRKLVSGATVVFFTAGYAGKRFVFERACELGIKSVIIDHPDSWSRSLVDEGIIAKFVPVDMNQSPTQVFEESLRLIKKLGEDGITGDADAVCTFVELSVPMVARFCEQLGLPGPTPDAVDTARDKHAARAALKAAGLPTPANMLVSKEAELDAAAKHVGFPMVMKPVSGAASLGVKKVCNKEELLSSYREVYKELSSLVVVSGALQKNDSSNKGVQADNVCDLTILLEQYLDGDEVDVDVVMSDGQWRYAGVTDNGPTCEPYFNETWAVCPSLLSLEKQRELKELAVASVEACGFEAGVFHVELKYTSSGPQLIEVNARMGGGPVRLVNQMVWGVDLVEEALFIALGVPARPAVPKEPNTCVSYHFIQSTKSGVVEQLPSLEKYQKRPGVVSMDYFLEEGDEVVGGTDGTATWLGMVIVEGPTSQGAVELMNIMSDEFPAKIRE